MEKFSSSQAKISKIFAPKPVVSTSTTVQEVTPFVSEIFKVDDCVFHADFGIGQIKETNQGSMGLTYKIHFNKDNHTRTLVAKYAVLNRLK